MESAATWHLENDLLLELRSNCVKGPSGFDSISVLAGVGYYFEQTLEVLDPRKTTREQTPANEVTVFVGQTIVNSLESGNPIESNLDI